MQFFHSFVHKVLSILLNVINKQWCNSPSVSSMLKSWKWEKIHGQFCFLRFFWDHLITKRHLFSFDRMQLIQGFILRMHVILMLQGATLANEIWPIIQYTWADILDTIKKLESFSLPFRGWAHFKAMKDKVHTCRYLCLFILQRISC